MMIFKKSERQSGIHGTSVENAKSVLKTGFDNELTFFEPQLPADKKYHKGVPLSEEDFQCNWRPNAREKSLGATKNRYHAAVYADMPRKTRQTEMGSYMIGPEDRRKGGIKVCRIEIYSEGGKLLERHYRNDEHLQKVLAARAVGKTGCQ